VVDSVEGIAMTRQEASAPLPANDETQRS